MKYTKENIFDGIDAKLDELFGGSEVTKTTALVFSQWLRQYPKEIEQNILEWVNNEPFSEIDFCGESIKHVADVMQLDSYSIPQLIKNFIDFNKTGCHGTYICYRYLEAEDE